MNFYSRTKLLIDKVITRSKYKCDIKASQEEHSKTQLQKK